jgi:hypothetical protein
LRRTRLGAVAAAAITAALTAAPPAHAGTTDKRKQAQGVLDKRAKTVLIGDKDGFLGTVDPQAPQKFKDAQSRLYDGLRSLPLADYRLQARIEDSGDLASIARGHYGENTDVYLPETRQSMRLKDYDAADAVDSLWLTFVERDNRWYIGGDNDVSPLGLDTTKGLWDFGAVVAQPTPHFLVLSHPAEAERAKALGAIAEEAVAALDSRWSQPWPHRIPVVLPGSVEELGAIIQATVDLDKFVAFVSYGAVRDTAYEPTAPRVYIQDKNLGHYSHRFQVETLTHELNHAAVAPISGPFIPAWVHEGVADWVATGRRTGERRPGGAGPHLPRDFEFTTGDQAAIVRSYASARSSMSVLAKAKGLDGPGAFIKALGEVRSAPGSVDYQVDQALRRSTGLGIDGLESLWGR